jgi:hypothetical protein
MGISVDFSFLRALFFLCDISFIRHYCLCVLSGVN